MKMTCMLALMMLVSAAGVSAEDKNKSDDDRGKVAASEHKDHHSKAADDPNKVICHTDQETGSRVHINRVCHTRAEWNELSQKTLRGLNDFATQSSTASKASGPFGGT